ncbi:MAG TPA: LPS assembly lipoprotein LptE [Dongiaceae bacterium]|jgi:LPS-assembly lipoprotein
MWSRRGILQSLLLAGAVLGTGAPLVGCGFQPMYGKANTNAAGSPVDRQMAGIRIEPISDRIGQQLHNALRDRFNPLGQPADSSYSLQVSLTVRVYGALARRDLSASRRNVEMNAFYYLSDTSGNQLMHDRSVITTGYDEFDDPLNDISALEDAERRGTLQVADQIRTRIAVFLTAGTPPSAAPEAVVPTTPQVITPSGDITNTPTPTTSSPYSTAP